MTRDGFLALDRTVSKEMVYFKDSLPKKRPAVGRTPDACREHPGAHVTLNINTTAWVRARLLRGGVGGGWVWVRGPLWEPWPHFAVASFHFLVTRPATYRTACSMPRATSDHLLHLAIDCLHIDCCMFAILHADSWRYKRGCYRHNQGGTNSNHLLVGGNTLQMSG